MNWKILSIISFALIIPVLVIWMIHSNESGQMLMFSRDKIEIKTKYMDEVFGTEVTKSEWKEGFWLGLLPPTDKISPSIILGAAPLSGIFFSLGVVFFFLNYKSKRK